VTFLDGTSTLGAATVNQNGQALFDTALLAIGTHSLSAKYEGFVQTGFVGSAPYAAAIFAASTSASVALSVGADPTTTSLSSSAPSVTSGSVITFTANIGSTAGVPFGGATFYDGNTVLGTLGLKADGSVSFSTASLSTGQHSITAAFNANGPFGGSTSPPVNISVVAAPATLLPTVASLASKISSTDGNSELAASVSALQGSPTGRVIFMDSGTILGQVATDQSGTAILRLGALPSGVHSFSASFTGGAEFAPSVSPELHDQWPETGPGFSLSLGSRNLVLTPAGSDPLQITVGLLSISMLPVNLSCAAGLPEGNTCDFTPTTLNGGGISTLTIRPSIGVAKRSWSAISLYAFLLGIAAFVMLKGGGRSRALLLLLMCWAFGGVVGCGISSSGAPRQIVVLTIRAESGTGSAAIVHSAQIPVIVKGLD
jgi:Bacterial Ig-like domain (group 3)